MSNTQTKRLGLFLAILMACSIGLTLADEGRIPLPQCPTCGPPFIIDAPGMYYLSGDFSSREPIITITTGDVDIDLNGFTAESTGAASTAALVFEEVDRVTVRNGTLIGVQRAIYARGGNTLLVDDVKLIANGSAGVELAGAGQFVIRRSTILGPSAGILAFGTLDSPITGTVEHNLVQQVDNGISVRHGRTIEIRNNRIVVLGDADGIRIDNLRSCLIAGNTVNGADGVGIGIHSSLACLVQENVITGTGSAGILVDQESEDQFLFNNSIHFGSSDGIRIEGKRNRLEENHVNGHRGFGVFLTGTSMKTVIRGNSGFSNTGIPANCPGSGATPNLCDAGAGTIDGGDNVLP